MFGQLFLFSDCTAPYSIDIEFDAISDELTTADNDFSSCGMFILENGNTIVGRNFFLL